MALYQKFLESVKGLKSSLSNDPTTMDNVSGAIAAEFLIFVSLILAALFLRHVSVVIFFTFVKAFHTVYLQPKPKDLKFAHDKIPKATVFSVAVLLIICLALGIFPNIVTDVFIPFAGGLI